MQEHVAAQSAEPKTILVVDDSPGNLEVVSGLLERHGYCPVVALGGEEAIRRAEFVHPDLILLDVLMPGLDGFETCRRLKAHPVTREIPVVFMTGLGDTSDKLAGFAAGAVDYMTKPLDAAEVMARIDTHLTLYALRRELAQRNAQLQQEVAARREAQAALERSNAELEQLAYVASHDMQEPLRMVASYMQLVAKRYQGRLDADADEFIGYAVEGAKRLQTLINDLLAYSRVGTKGRPFEPTDCAQVVDTALMHLRVAIAEVDATVHVGPMPTVSGDALQLTQLFQNLIGNAIKFRRGDVPPEVWVEAEPAEGGWRFSVRDNGIGIAEEHFERIFALFSRLHGRREYPGTGIGLAICKRIVERHGGHIGVASEPDKGATFFFTLPAATAG